VTATSDSEHHEDKRFLRLLTCGSVDDGKSTLIGRMLYDARLLLDDQLSALVRDSSRADPKGRDLDFALILDGLEAEREQGITIDVAYRFFSTPARSFLVADAPGHEEYTRNMATAASNSEVAVLLLDVRSGVTEQTRRHAFICSLFGVRHVVLAVNKIDLVDYSREAFQRSTQAFEEFSSQLSFSSYAAIPVSARYGENVAHRSSRTPWYEGPTLLHYLEQVKVDPDWSPDFRFPVQAVLLIDAKLRGLMGTVATGSISIGDEILCACSGQRALVARISQSGKEVQRAESGAAATLFLDRDVDVPRGEVLSSPNKPPLISEQFTARVLCTSDASLLPGRSYHLRIGTAWTPAVLTGVEHKIDFRTLLPVSARQLETNEIGLCEFTTNRRVAFDPYVNNRATGAFILVDRVTSETAGAGLIDSAPPGGGGRALEPLSVDRQARARLMGQEPSVLWFTGLSGAGKSTIAKEVERQLHSLGRHTYVLDGDNLRHSLNKDLGFSPADRVENIRRAGEVAKLMWEAGLIVLCAFISPFRAERRAVRELFAPTDFLEIYVDTPLSLCMRRDPKGLYARARAGLLPSFTGMDSPYEAPESPELILHTEYHNLQAEVAQVLDLMRQRRLLV
jgi:bifunctional enzyme CysN/CysC